MYGILREKGEKLNEKSRMSTERFWGSILGDSAGKESKKPLEFNKKNY